MSKVFDIGQFWPRGLSQSEIWRDYQGRGLSREGLRKARHGQLTSVSPEALETLIAIAEDLVGREVSVKELIKGVSPVASAENSPPA